MSKVPTPSEWAADHRGEIMKSRDFCYWLQGFFELTGSAAITEPQADMIRVHLALVFKHEIDDPSMGGAGHQSDLDKLHGAGGAKPADGVVYRC